MPKVALTEAQRRENELRRQEDAEKRQLERTIKIINMARVEAGLSENLAFAAALGLKPNTCSNKMGGKRPWTVSELIRVADVLHMEPLTRSALLGGKEKCRYERGFVPAS